MPNDPPPLDEAFEGLNMGGGEQVEGNDEAEVQAEAVQHVQREPGVEPEPDAGHSKQSESGWEFDAHLSCTTFHTIEGFWKGWNLKWTCREETPKFIPCVGDDDLEVTMNEDATPSSRLPHRQDA